MEEQNETGFGPEAEVTGAARAPGAPVFVANAAASITIALDGAGNDPVVTHSLRVKRDPELDGTYVVMGYVQADGSIDAGEVFQTLAVWGATVVVDDAGLTAGEHYTFASRASNEASVLTAWSSESAVMFLLPLLDEGVDSGTVAHEYSGGNTKLDETYGIAISGDTVDEVTDQSEYYGTVTASFEAVNYDSETSSVECEFSEDSGANYTAATGSPKGSIASSPAGVVGTFSFNSYADCGNSERKETVRLRLRALDGDGAAGQWVESADFIVNNLPAPIEWSFAEFIDGKWETSAKTFDKASPVFIAVIPNLRGGSGSVGYPVIGMLESDGSTAVDGYPKKSYESIAGWMYESAEDTWEDLTAAGIPYSVCGGTLRLLYQTSGLAVGEYEVYGRMAETRERG